MKKGLLYYCLVLSVIFHLVLVVIIRLDQSKKKEKEPVVIDLVGPMTPGPKTVLPSGKEEKPPFAQKEEKAPTRMARIMPYIRPSFPSMPSPAPSAPRAPAPSAPSAQPPAPGGVTTPAPPLAQIPAAPSAPSAGRGSPPSAARPGGGGYEEQRRPLVGLNQQELARIERETEPEKKDGTVTLDDEDMRLTGYLHGLKSRIEAIWKYPETARRDGLQGSLVMKFTIARSGKVERENIEVVKSSGYPMLDDAARQALIDASPFNPLPGSWKKDSLTITGTFIYVLRGIYLE